jgi:hypothetical protein
VQHRASSKLLIKHEIRRLWSFAPKYSRDGVTVFKRLGLITAAWASRQVLEHVTRQRATGN